MRAALGSLALVASSLILFSTAASAGTTGSLSGRVTNSITGAPVSGAKISASSGADVQVTRSDAHGNFFFVSLQPGTYVVTVDRDGFEATSIAGVTIATDSNREIVVSAKPAEIAIVMLDGPFTFYGIGMGVGPGRIRDVYTQSAYRTLPVSAPPIADLTFLQMTPGITFGTGAPMAH